MIGTTLGLVVAAFTTLVPVPDYPPYAQVGRDAHSICHQMLSSRMEPALVTTVHPQPVDTPVAALGIIPQPFPSEYRFAGVRWASASQDISDGCLRFLPPELGGTGGRLEHLGEPPRYHYDYSYGPGQELSRLVGTSGTPVDVIVG